MVLLDPWKYRYSEAYQLTQALLAFGQGGWFGVGLGNSVQKQFYLPEAHGFLVRHSGRGARHDRRSDGAGDFWRGGRRAPDWSDGRREKTILQRLCAYSFALLFAAQAAVNMGVNTGLLPTGLTLPFMTWRLVLIVSGMMLGMLQRIRWEVEHG